VKDGKKAMLLEVGKIFYLEAQGNYTKVISPSGQILMRRPIRYFEERFDPKLFLRANRSLMLNLELVTRWEAIAGGRFKAFFDGGASFEISRRQSRSLQERMKL
jgi:DNA-binding LytR/AlgR family response regulator